MKGIASDVPTYSISFVKENTGLTCRQIRYYEKVGLVKPARTKGNQRIYSEDDIDELNKIKELMGRGINIAGIKKMEGLS